MIHYHHFKSKEHEITSLGEKKGKMLKKNQIKVQVMPAAQSDSQVLLHTTTWIKE